MGPAALLCPPSTSVHLPAQSICHRCNILSSSSILKKRPSLYFFKSAPDWRVRKNTCSRKVFAVAGDVAISVPDLTVSETEVNEDEVKGSIAIAVDSSSSSEKEQAKPQERRRRSSNTSNSSKAVTVSNEELVTGATFPGKVSTIQTFGAFVDIGAFTNGLVHISRLSKNYVKKVEDVVQVGQDVSVQIVDVDLKAKRISLMLIEEEKGEGSVNAQGDGEGEGEGEGEGGKASSKRPPRRGRPQKVSKLKIGEVVAGSVKNMIRSGVFLSLPDGTDGYLPSSEVIFRGPNTNLESQFQVGQEVSVRVLRVDKGRVTLTTRQEVNFDKINEELNKDVAQRATNPFEIAFRGNGSIASLLAEREKISIPSEVEDKEEKEEVRMEKDVSGLVDDVEKVDETLIPVVSEDTTNSEVISEGNVSDSIEATRSVDASDAIIEEKEGTDKRETSIDGPGEVSEEQDIKA